MKLDIHHLIPHLYSVLVILFALSVSLTYCYDEKYYLCNHRIYSENNLLSQNELHRLCDLILKKDRFTILITEKKEFKTDQEYTKESEQFFNKHCVNNAISCTYAFSISIFANVRKLRVTAGKSASNMLSKNQWESITQAMGFKLKRRDYYDAIEEGIGWLDKSAPYDSIIDFPKHDNDDNHKPKPKNGFGFGSFVLFVLLPCCGCGALWYFYFYKAKIDNANANLNTELNALQLNNASVSEGFNPTTQKETIHFHIIYLLELIKQIKSQMPPIITIDKCIICQQKIPFTGSKQYIEMIQLNIAQSSLSQLQTNPNTHEVVDNINTRFGCLHLYHRDCLRKFNLSKCIMCYQSLTNTNSSEVILNNYDTQVIEDNHILTLIKNMPLIYSIQALEDYSLSYHNEFLSLCQSYVPNLDLIWGISPNRNTINTPYINSYTPPNNNYRENINY